MTAGAYFQEVTKAFVESNSYTKQIEHKVPYHFLNTSEVKGHHGNHSSVFVDRCFQ